MNYAHVGAVHLPASGQRPIAFKEFEKAAAIFRGRYLVVRREGNLTDGERAELEVLFGYEPELRVLWRFTQEIYAVLSDGPSSGAAWAGWARLRRHRGYRAVPELSEALELLSVGVFAKVMAFPWTAVTSIIWLSDRSCRTNQRREPPPGGSWLGPQYTWGSLSVS